MRVLLKLAALAGIGYALWRLLNDAASDAPPEPSASGSGSDSRSSSGSSTPSPAAGDGNSNSMSKAERYERAKELDIEGRSKMSKQQLERAIAEAG
jgi:DNA end-binding protein Ku